MRQLELEDDALVESKPSCASYRVHRIRAPVHGAEEAGWRCIERMEVESLDRHDADPASPEGAAPREELHGRFLDRSKNIDVATDAVEGENAGS